jgi:hypothetical protein
MLPVEPDDQKYDDPAPKAGLLLLADSWGIGLLHFNSL